MDLHRGFNQFRDIIGKEEIVVKGRIFLGQQEWFMSFPVSVYISDIWI